MGFELGHEVLVAPGAAPRRSALFLHGILGQGANWRTVGRALVERDPGWAAVLVDLRLHGASADAPPPHTLATAADDVERLAARLAAPLGALVGHSFGGKVALIVRGRAPAGLVATAIFDASPSARPERADAPATPSSVLAVLAALAAVPTRYPRREGLVAALGERGVDARVGHWLAMSLVHDDDGYRLRFDLEGIRALLLDYLAVDAWAAVEDPALPGSLTFHVAGGSDVVDDADRARLAALAPRVTTHVYPGADHWMLRERERLALPPAGAGAP